MSTFADNASELLLKVAQTPDLRGAAISESEGLDDADEERRARWRRLLAILGTVGAGTGLAYGVSKFRGSDLEKKTQEGLRSLKEKLQTPTTTEEGKEVTPLSEAIRQLLPGGREGLYGLSGGVAGVAAGGVKPTASLLKRLVTRGRPAPTPAPEPGPASDPGLARRFGRWAGRSLFGETSPTFERVLERSLEAAPKAVGKAVGKGDKAVQPGLLRRAVSGMFSRTSPEYAALGERVDKPAVRELLSKLRRDKNLFQFRDMSISDIQKNIANVVTGKQKSVPKGIKDISRILGGPATTDSKVKAVSPASTIKGRLSELDTLLGNLRTRNFRSEVAVPAARRFALGSGAGVGLSYLTRPGASQPSPLTAADAQSP